MKKNPQSIKWNLVCNLYLPFPSFDYTSTSILHSNFCGYGAYTDNFENPPIEWNMNNTYIQDKGINQDFGLFDTPDDFYAKHQQKLGAIKKFIFRNFVRQIMNKNVEKIRTCG